MSDDHDLAGDLMLGATPIAAFLSSLFDGEEITPTDVYNWCSRGTLPHSKLGNKIVGSKSQIRAHFYASSPAAAARPSQFDPRRS
jgi:hypothetical protein